MSSIQNSLKYSIFDPNISMEHREFYESIVNELNCTLAICNQGRATASEVCQSESDRRQIFDLMSKMESFCTDLLQGTKALFDQTYQAKEQFKKSILTAVAANKINLIDRNLLERTCDVRWWSMETAFWESIESFMNFRAEIKAMLELFYMMEGDEHAPKLDALVKELFVPGGKFFDLAIDPEQTFPPFDYAAEKASSDAVKNKALGLNITAAKLKEKLLFACTRLEDIRSSYTLYRDLIITLEDGTIVANANEKERARILGCSVADEKWFNKALELKTSEEYFAQDVSPSVVERLPSLVYSTAIRKKGRVTAEALGAMGVYFDFQGEAGLILNEGLECDASGEPKQDWLAFISERNGLVIASNSVMVEEQKQVRLPKQHLALEKGGHFSSKTPLMGFDATVCSSKTSGYLEYEGLGWNSHIAIPNKDVFESNQTSSNVDISPSELMSAKIIPEINRKTYEKIQLDKESIELISLNGIVYASKLGEQGAALKPVFDRITDTGTFATKKMEVLLEEMASEKLRQTLEVLETLSKEAIDLIDRNLFERAADIRWWATDMFFWRALQEPTEANQKKACERLAVINKSYTMYRLLLLTNREGKVVACQNLEALNDFESMSLTGESWYADALQTKSSSEFAVQDARRSSFEPKQKMSLVYAGGIREQGAREGEAIGALGIYFDWSTESKTMLQGCLPKNGAGQPEANSAAFYTNKEGIVIETTDEKQFPVGKKAITAQYTKELEKGQSISGLYTHEGERYLYGATRTCGYREYAGLEWVGNVVMPLNPEPAEAVAASSDEASEGGEEGALSESQEGPSKEDC